MHRRMTSLRIEIYMLAAVLNVPAAFPAGQKAGAIDIDSRRESMLDNVVIAKLSAAEALSVVCLGDSVTGIYYHTGGRRAYPEMLELALQQAWPGARLKVINAGISGNTTRDALARIQRDVLDHQPDVVTVMFGLNDIARVPIEQFEANLNRIVEQCRGIGAEVLLCTPNSVVKGTPGRPRDKLVRYSDVIRELGRKLGVPVCDCYESFEAARAHNPLAWRMLMSDDFHPSMDGHKLIAAEITRSITGREVSLQAIGPPFPAIPKTLSRLRDAETVRVLAMPPYDELIEPALKHLEPSARVQVTPWPAAGQSLAQIEAAARRVRQMDLDLVMLAMPVSAEAATVEQFARSYTSIMKLSLSFGQQDWDVIVIAPSVADPESSRAQSEHEQLSRKLVRAYDLSLIDRRKGNDSPAAAILANWLLDQAENHPPR